MDTTRSNKHKKDGEDQEMLSIEDGNVLLPISIEQRYHLTEKVYKVSELFYNLLMGH